MDANVSALSTEDLLDELVRHWLESQGRGDMVERVLADRQMRDLLVQQAGDDAAVAMVESIPGVQIDEWGGSVPFQVLGSVDGTPFYLRHRERLSIAVADAPGADPVGGRTVYLSDDGYDEYDEQPHPTHDRYVDVPGSYVLSALLTAVNAVRADARDQARQAELPGRFVPQDSSTRLQNQPMELLGDRTVTLTGREARRQAERDARTTTRGTDDRGGQYI